MTQTAALANSLCCHWCKIPLGNATIVSYLNGNLPVCDSCLSKNSYAALAAELEKVKAERGKLSKFKKAVQNDRCSECPYLHDAQKGFEQLAAKTAECERLKKALSQYADDENYSDHEHDCGYISNGRAATYTYHCTDLDSSIAKAALSGGES